MKAVVVAVVLEVSVGAVAAEAEGAMILHRQARASAWCGSAALTLQTSGDR